MKDDSFFFFWTSLGNKEAEEMMKAQGFHLAPSYFFWCKDEGASYCPIPDRAFAQAVEYAFYGWKGNPVLQQKGKLNYDLDRLVRNKVHPHEKPVRMQADLIKRFLLPGSTVLDPWAGSTSVIRAALNAGMKPLGFEQNENYYASGLIALNSHLNGE
jgi:DNA modification methylase